MNFLVLPNTERKIFWRKFVTRLFWGTIDFHSRKRKYYGSQWCPRTALFPTFFRISSFVFSRTKTFIQVWNYLRVSKWHNLIFWVNYPFNSGWLIYHIGWYLAFLLCLIIERQTLYFFKNIILQKISKLLQIAAMVMYVLLNIELCDIKCIRHYIGHLADAL